MLKNLSRTATVFAWLGCSTLIVSLDQMTKQFFNQSLALYQAVPVFPSFNLRLAYNHGASFSFLSEAGGWQRWFFALIAIAIVVYLIKWLFEVVKISSLQSMSISLIIGGAVGNLIDRLYYGYVIDFIELYYQNWSWPVFNIADIAVCSGAFILALSIYREH